MAGNEGSIIIDGTEHCPGKQGVNLISLDFVNYKYSKGRVIRPEELQAFVANHFESWKKSDPVFVVTQGDCTVLFEGQTIPDAFNQLTRSENRQFLYSPSWCFILTPNDTKIQHGKDNIDYKVEIRMNDFVSVVLKESFSEPLIDVLLSMPPASNINKTLELELIEILTRHSYQRKAIVASNRFISYLYELLWAVASSKSHDFKEIENTTKISHCLSSLKILHSCSVDSDCLQDLLGQGLLQVLGAVLNTILLYLLNLSKSVSSESSQKSTWYDLIETPVPEEKEDCLNEPIEDDNDDTIFHDVLEARSPIFSNYDSDGSEVNDELFQLADTGSQSETPQPTRRRTIRYADEMMSESPTGGGERSQDEVNSSRRMRTDSFIVRSDSRQLRREDSRRQSFLDIVSSTEVGTERAFSVLDMRPTSITASVPVEHQQLRRISRSMSVSMQQTKSSGKIDEEHSTSLNDVLMKMLNHTVILLYRVTNTADEKVQETLHSMSILPMLLALPGCVNKEFKRRIDVAVTSGLMNVNHKNRGQGNMEKELVLEHVGETKSCILSSNKLEVSNENWYFESVKFNQGISKGLYEDCKITTPKGWYYEVEIGSEGIIQIGYANDACQYDAKKGIGIGDTVNSYGFDGARRKIWSGPTCDIIVDNDYGIEWQSGDIVSVLLTWNGILSYWLNGKNLGVAMRNIDTSKIWYPGLSLSVDQYCRFIVNRNEFRYKCPEGYHSIPDIRNFTMAKREQESQEPTIPPTDNNCLNLTGKQASFEQKVLASLPIPALVENINGVNDPCSVCKGSDLVSSYPNVWNEIFLLKVNVPYLEELINSLEVDALMKVKKNINELFSKCCFCLKEDHQIKIINALQTLCTILKCVFAKKFNDFGFNIISLLIGFDEAEAVMQRMIESLCSFLLGDYSVSLKNLVLKLLLIIATAVNNVSSNTFLEYFMLTTIFETLAQILADATLRFEHGYESMLLLCILCNYRKNEMQNPYLMKLSILDDELALNGLGLLISDILSVCNKKFAVKKAKEEPTGGLLTSITSFVGSMFVQSDTDKASVSSKNDAILLALYEAVLVNRNFFTVLSHVMSHEKDHVDSPTNTSPVIERSLPLPVKLEEQEELTIDEIQSGNLLATFLRFSSIAIQDTKTEHGANTARLCLIILNCIVEDQYANAFLHDSNMTFTVPIYRMNLYHRKVGLEIPSSRPLASVLLDLMVEFCITHMMKIFPVDLYKRCIGTIHRCLCYQKRCRIRLQYDWRNLWTALMNLLKFIISNESNFIPKYPVFDLAIQVINIFNLFITYGDTFLPSSTSYDELYYEIIRVHQIFDNLYTTGCLFDLALRYVSSEADIKASAQKLSSCLVNVRAIIHHFAPKIDSFSQKFNKSSLTEDEVLEVIRGNYETLTLKLLEGLDSYAKYNEAPVESPFFTQLMRSITEHVRSNISITNLEQLSVLQEFSSIT